MGLDVAAPFDIDVEHHVLATLGLGLDLRLQGAVEAVLVHLFIFEELTCVDLRLELLRCEEEILHTIALRAARRTRRGTDGESEAELRMLLHQPLYDRALARPARGRKDYQFTCLFHIRKYFEPYG